MKLYYSGHRYVFACEQSLLVLFPEERPEYPETRDTENAAYISLSEGNRWATAVTRLYRDGRRCLGTARIERCRLTASAAHPAPLLLPCREEAYGPGSPMGRPYRGAAR